jgi:Ni,Fe-hydrogenase III large subunit
MALEGLTGSPPSDRALLIRALLLERERVANHLGDLGYLGNDCALAFGFAQFWRLKEDVLRMNERLFGHRYLMDRIVPGGVACDVDAAAAAALNDESLRLKDEVRTLRSIYYNHAGLQDRCITTGRLAPDTAARLGVVGLARARAATRWTPAHTRGLRRTTGCSRKSSRIATAMSPRASWCGSRKCSNRCGCSASSCAILPAAR